MPRRVSLPGASELFRSTGAGEPDQRDELRIADPQTYGDPRESFPVDPGTAESQDAGPVVEPLVVVPDRSSGTGRRRGEPATGTGRVRHDEKITVYVSSDELIALEETRLRLRADHGVAVDRGRIVRLAISAAMADFATNGDSSELVRKLAAS